NVILLSLLRDREVSRSWSIVNGYKSAVFYKIKSMGDILVVPLPGGKRSPLSVDAITAAFYTLSL
ncbi:MAG: hypothetical protein CME75_07180, partial [Halomonas sp.]|nr:hypothetical protein [Halomonas sp.]